MVWIFNYYPFVCRTKDILISCDFLKVCRFDLIGFFFCILIYSKSLTNGPRKSYRLIKNMCVRESDQSVLLMLLKECQSYQKSKIPIASGNTHLCAEDFFIFLLLQSPIAFTSLIINSRIFFITFPLKIVCPMKMKNPTKWTKFYSSWKAIKEFLT